MIDHIDEALLQFLIRELPMNEGKIDISFDLPRREWSAQINRPTLNVFLYDLKENSMARHATPARAEGDSNDIHQRPIQLELRYMLTAWADKTDAEHRLLGQTLLALSRVPVITADLLPEDLREHTESIRLIPDLTNTLTDSITVWNAVDNDLRPSLLLIVSASLSATSEHHPSPGTAVLSDS